MTFDSLTFVVFLAAIFGGYWSVRSWTARKIFLLAASYLFYAAWNPFFVLLIIATTGFDWLASHWMDRAQHPSYRKAILASSIAINLGALGFFKYAQFFSDNAVDLLHVFGINFEPVSLGILLPVGISFYTFESLSYVIDVYRRRIAVSKSLLDYGLYVTFFPHLVAGPILRYGDFSPQCAQAKSWASAEVGKGLALFVYGLALKVCLADLVFAPVVDRVFAPGVAAGFGESWLGAASFSLQAYCDFAGYSLCAIGVALMFGFRFPMNFESPFGSVGMAELWTRWHMSLASWIRDYVFLPLGGYRRGRLRGEANLLFAFLLVGLWHGAAWTFVLWGGIHGLGLATERALGWRPTSSAARWFGRVLTFHVVCFAWIFFRADSFSRAGQVLERLFTAWGQSSPLVTTSVVLAIAVGIAGQYVRPSAVAGVVGGFQRLPALAQAGCIAVVLVAINTLGPEGVAPFIYFRF